MDWLMNRKMNGWINRLMDRWMNDKMDVYEWMNEWSERGGRDTNG